MKYLKRFANAQEAATVLAVWPFNTVSSIKSVAGAVISEGVEPPVDATTPFFIENVSNNINTVSILKGDNGTITAGSAPTLTIEKSTDGTNWESMGTTSTTAITATIPAKGKLYLRCNTTAWAGGNITSASAELAYNYISTTDNCNVGGNIMSLLYGNNFANERTFSSGYKYCFCYLFRYNTKIISANKLILPTNATVGCYYSMFSDCTSLTTGPEIPVTSVENTLACFYYMFSGCTNLNYVKCLIIDPNSLVQSGGYYNCTKNWLNNVAVSGTFVQNINAISAWRTGVSAIPNGWTIQYSNGIKLTQELNVATINVVDLDNGTCYYTINNGSHVLLNNGITTISITQVMNNQTLLVHGEFNGETIEKTLTLSWTDYTPNIVINQSNNIVTITATNADTIQYRLGSTGEYSTYTTPIQIESDTTIYVIANKTVSGVVYTSEASQSIIYHPMVTEPFYVENITQQNETLVISHNATSDYELHIPVQSSTDGENWTSLGTLGSNTRLTVTLAPGDKLYLRANASCWWRENCEDQWCEQQQAKITGVSKVGGNINSLVYGTSFQGQAEFNNTAANIFKQIFSGNTNLIDASDLKLPATTLTSACYYGMFNGCTSLTTAPELPATTLVSSCYNNMFRNCTNLNYIKCLATNISASGCLSNWTYAVAATGTFVKDANTTWSTGVSGIPSGWTVENAA